MKEPVRKKLLDLNRIFYAEMAAEFDHKRQGTPPGLEKLLDHLPQPDKKTALTVLDAGCGNGRFARILDKASTPFVYLGIDGSAELLSLAEENTAGLAHGKANFFRQDFTDARWSSRILSDHGAFDLVLCTAVLHHLPDYRLRLDTVRQLRDLTQKRLILSSWQFLTSPRFVKKRIPWDAVGLSEDDVESGDALLPWQHGRYMIRYVHQVDSREFRRLAGDADLQIIDEFRADGREGNLSLYTILEPASHDHSQANSTLSQ